jgi:hypothetical protein
VASGVSARASRKLPSAHDPLLTRAWALFGRLSPPCRLNTGDSREGVFVDLTPAGKDD